MKFLLASLFIVGVLALPPPGFPDEVLDGYPQGIAAKWNGVPSNPDAVFQRTSNGKIYFFKGKQDVDF